MPNLNGRGGAARVKGPHETPEFCRVWEAKRAAGEIPATMTGNRDGYARAFAWGRAALAAEPPAQPVVSDEPHIDLGRYAGTYGGTKPQPTTTAEPQDPAAKLLAQIEATIRRVAQWPAWMKQSAVVATATLPRSGAALAAEPQPPVQDAVAWQHESKECSLGAAGMHNIITTAVRDLWLKANPKQVEHYTKPLYAAPALAAEPQQPVAWKEPVSQDPATQIQVLMLTTARDSALAAEPQPAPTADQFRMYDEWLKGKP